MGSVGDNEMKIKPIKNNLDAYLNDFDTQPVDDEISLLPDELCGGFEGDDADGFQYLQNTAPVDEFFPFGDAFETQMVNLGCETQVAELCGETQPMDVDGCAQLDELCGETQQVDLVGYTQVDELCGETQPADLVGYTQVDELCGETQPVDLGGHTQVAEICGETQLVDLGGHTQVAEICGETQLVDLGGHTQVAEICGETQLVDHGGHTQVVEICGETQLVDYGGHNTQLEELRGETRMEDLGGETQVLDHCKTEVPVDYDDKGDSETEVFCDTQVISVEDSVQRSGNCSVDQWNTQSSGLNKESGRDSRAEPDEKLLIPSELVNYCSDFSGSMLKGFTSIRAASLRASGLAAQNMALKRNKTSCSASDKSLELHHAEKDGIFLSRYPLMFGNECNLSSQKDSAVDSRELLELGDSETELFCDTQVISVEDSVQRSGNCSVDQWNTQSSGLNKESGRDSRAEPDDKLLIPSELVNCCSDFSGSMLKGFTSIRAASLRASGLAAQNMALKRNKTSCSASDKFLELHNAEKDGIFLSRYPLKFGNECNLSSQKDSAVDSRELPELGDSETELFCDTQVISVEDSVQRSGNCSVDQWNTQSCGLNKESGRDSRAKPDEKLLIPSELVNCCSDFSGSMLKGFTSIRAASLRASGLAAQNMALKRNKTSCSASDKSLELHNAEKDGIFLSRYPLKFGNECNLSSQKDSAVDSRELLELGNECKQIDQKHTQEEHDQQIEFRNENSRKLGSSTARKLFMDDNASDIRQVDDGTDNADNTDLPLVFASEDGLGGLSYVDSQEPGELSQANALEVVDKIVKLNMMECVEKVFFKGSTDGKSKPVSSAKGTQSLAKKAATRMREVENGAFSWDDNLEDEGGGDFFQKKKELFFDSGSQRRRSLKLSGKSWCQSPKSCMSAQENGDEEQLNNNRKLKDAVLSDSRLLSKSLSLNGKSCELTEASLKRNLMKELDEDINAVSGDRQADGRNDKDAPKELDVGLDTQMAADAMEALRFAASFTDNDGNGGIERMKKSSCGEAGSKSNLEQNLHHKEACSSGAGFITRQRKRARTTVESNTELSVLSCKQSKNSKKKLDAQLGKREPKKGKLDQKDFVENMRENLSNVSKMFGQSKEDKINETRISRSRGPKSLKNLPMQDQYDSFIPVAHRTRGSLHINHSQCGNDLKRSKEHVDVIGHVSQRKRSWAKAYTSETSMEKSDQASKLGNINVKQPNIVDHPKGRRTRSRFALVGQEETIECNKRSKLSKVDDKSPSTTKKDLKKHLDVGADRSTQASVDRNTSGIQEDVIQTKSSKSSAVKRNKDNKKSTEGENVTSSPEASSKVGHKSSALEHATPISCATPVNDASPICKGDEYNKQSCRKNLLRPSLSKEINSLLTTGPEPTCAMKDSRRRRDMTNVRVLFSRHLDADIIKHQKKILNRLGSSVASSMSDASHFVTDEFARTRNMLEAIAFGKPVVTPLWLESCGQASCFIDERSYILRDARKEKEFGFSMPVSLARASQHPLLQGQRVLITPNTKPGKEILASLVKAVHGLAVERLGRSSLKEEKFPDDLLVLSCEEDYEICVPFLEKGAAVYSSELLLNGIVTQRLDYERHKLFSDNVKRTRSTIWLKRNNNVYIPVCKSK